jgi:hypothetical protein
MNCDFYLFLHFQCGFILILFEYIYRLYGVMVNMFASGALARGFGSSQKLEQNDIF